MKRMLPGTSQRELRLEPTQRDGGAIERIVGYGAVFYNPADPGSEYWLWEDVVERIMPGAFDRALREDDVQSFFNHDANFILGRTSAKTLELAIDSVGLRYSVTPSDSLIAQHALEAVRRRDVKGSSFMFDVWSANWIEEKREGSTLWIREITEVKPLYEVGPVCFPAYEGTTAETDSRSLRTDGAGPTAAPWREWHERHVTRAKQSLQEFRDLRTREMIGDAAARQRRRRQLRDLELRRL